MNIFLYSGMNEGTNMCMAIRGPKQVFWAPIQYKDDILPV